MKKLFLSLFVVVCLAGKTSTHATTEADNMAPVSGSQLANVSTRALVQTGDDVLIGGFIVQGMQPKRVIIRAIGPELAPFGIPDPLADPTLELHDSTGALIASNDNWMTTIIGGIITTDQVAAIRASGYAPGDFRESEMVVSLPPGNYTAIVRGIDSTMIGGFIVQETQAKRVIVRALGPELTPFGLPNPLADPNLERHDRTGASIASNDNWMTTIIGGIITADQVRDIINSG